MFQKRLTYALLAIALVSGTVSGQASAGVFGKVLGKVGNAVDKAGDAVIVKPGKALGNAAGTLVNGRHAQCPVYQIDYCCNGLWLPYGQTTSKQHATSVYWQLRCKNIAARWYRIR